MTAKISAIELFKQFQPRFRAVTWKPLGFASGDPTHRFYFAPEKNNYSYHKFPYIDLALVGVKCTCPYDSSEPTASPMDQIARCIWQRIVAGPFAGVKFFADPADGAVEKEFREYTKIGLYGRFPIVFSYDGDLIPGLDLKVQFRAYSWDFFIPRDSPECRAVHAALMVERTEVARREKLGKFASREILERNLQNALAAVPT